MRRMGRPLLVVVDMQHVFADPENPWAAPGFGDIVGPVERLVEAFRDRVVFTRFIVPDHPEGSWKDYYDRWDFVRRPGSGSLFELVSPWAEREVRTISAPTFSKWGPELEALAGPDRTLVVCGVATDCCVIATVIGALDAGMRVRVVSDACAGTDDAAHGRAIALMRGFIGQVEITSVHRELVEAERLEGLVKKGSS